MTCIACGHARNGNLDPELCMRCVNARARWQDAASWLPLAKLRIADLEAERDLFRRETVALAKDAISLTDEVRRLRDVAHKAADAIVHALYSEDGLDCSVGEPLLDELSALGVVSALLTAQGGDE